jgi:hypothetical protein
MPVQQAANRRTRPWAGVILLALGTVLMLAQAGWIAVQVEHLASSFWSGALDVSAALILTVLRLLRTAAFDPAAAAALAGSVLVSSLALAAILSGLVLLRKRIAETAQ